MIVPVDQPLIVAPVGDDDDEIDDDVMRAALAAIGSWADADWDDVETEV